MKIEELLKSSNITYEISGPDCEISGLACHSKKIHPGFVFFALRGENEDGYQYIEEAIKNGAIAVVSDKDFSSASTLTKVLVKNIRANLVEIARAFYGTPSNKLQILAVTGTNGKTTVTYLLEKIFQAAQQKAGVIGTINYRLGDSVLVSANTTPGPLELQELFFQMREKGIHSVIIEVSSHALVQDRANGIDFACAAFTNLGRDHLDYHLNLNNYFLAKAKLFENLKKDSWAVINIDDMYGKKLIKKTQAQLLTVSLKKKDADFFGQNLQLSLDSCRFLLKTPKGSLEVNSPLIGLHNVYNIMIATAMGFSQGLDPKAIQQGISALEKVPGRLEVIKSARHFKVFVDYAHTPDALNNILKFLRALSKGRLITVFGCGGDRDRGKRPIMGKVAAIFSDQVIITNDNPRSEDPQKIAEEISAGINNNFQNFKIILDRKLAIKEALVLAKADDVVVVAGKGHECYQIFKNGRIPFDDIETVKELLC